MNPGSDGPDVTIFPPATLIIENIAKCSGGGALEGTENIMCSTEMAYSPVAQSLIQTQRRQKAPATISAPTAVGQTMSVRETVTVAPACCEDGSGSRGGMSVCNGLTVEGGDHTGPRTTSWVELEHHVVRSASDDDPMGGSEATFHDAVATACSGKINSRRCCNCKADCWFACGCSCHDEMSGAHLPIVQDGEVITSPATAAMEYAKMKNLVKIARSGSAMTQGAEMVGNNTTRKDRNGKRQNEHGPMRHHRDRSPTVGSDVPRAFLATSESRATKVVRLGTAPRLNSVTSGYSATLGTTASGRVDYYDVR